MAAETAGVAATSPTDVGFKRELGLIGATWASETSIIGSGWLFGALFAALFGMLLGVPLLMLLVGPLLSPLQRRSMHQRELMSALSNTASDIVGGAARFMSVRFIASLSQTKVRRVSSPGAVVPVLPRTDAAITNQSPSHQATTKGEQRCERSEPSASWPSRRSR